MNERGYIPPEQSPDPAETPAENAEVFISIEELAGKIEAMKADEAVVLEHIFEAANSLAVPDPEDEAACREYARVQTEIQKFALIRLGRSEVVKEFDQWLVDKRAESGKND